MKPRLSRADLPGVARLATDATAGLADLVESLHERIARLPGFPAPEPAGRTRGITGLVYRTVRGVTRVVGGSIEALLGLLTPALQDTDPVPGREALVAALNGVLGDYLLATGNPLATPMTLRRDGRLLDLDAFAAEPGGAAGPGLLLMLHGLCLNDLQWRRDGHDHGAALADATGLTTVHVRYNSGLHVSINGRELDRQLEDLVDRWPGGLPRIVMLGHSMGGLLARSALHHGTLAGHRWPQRVTDLLCLGTPHHGAPLERAGNWANLILGATPYAAPFARLGRVRSAGITDLRHGNLLDEDWVGLDRFAHRSDRRQPVPLPEGVRCFALAASVGRRTGDLKDRLLGDGLVPLDSALGRHPDPQRSLDFAPERQWTGYGIGHLDLLAHPEVAAQLLAWVAPTVRRP